MKLLTSLTFKLPLLALLSYLAEMNCICTSPLLQALCSVPHDSSFWGFLCKQNPQTHHCFSKFRGTSYCYKMVPNMICYSFQSYTRHLSAIPWKILKLLLSTRKCRGYTERKNNLMVNIQVLLDMTLGIFIFFAVAFPLVKEDSPLPLTGLLWRTLQLTAWVGRVKSRHP